jgi:short-subunit dehydrogenase
VRELRGKVAVVTGAAGGIGAAIAARLAREGMRLALVDLREEALAEVRDALGASAHAMDVGDRDAWAALARTLRETHGAVDLLVNNAGVTVHGAFARQSLDDVERVVRVNLLGVLYACHTLLPLLRASGDAHIVNVSSLAGAVAVPYQSVYSATKYAVRGASHALRMELEGERIGVTTVLPGTVATRLLETATSYDRTASSRIAELMLARGMRPSVVAERVVRAIRANEAEVMVGWDAHLAIGVHAVAPGLFDRALAAGFRWRERSAR